MCAANIADSRKDIGILAGWCLALLAMVEASASSPKALSGCSLLDMSFSSLASSSSGALKAAGFFEAPFDRVFRGCSRPCPSSS